MRISKNFVLLSLMAATFFLAVSACKKDNQLESIQVPVNLPAGLALEYGQQEDITIPEELSSQTKLNFELAFTETANTEIQAGSKLHEKMAKAITLDRKAGKIHVDARGLYPNGSASSVNGNKIPDTYKITLRVSSADGSMEGSQTIDLKVSAAKLDVKGWDNSIDIPYAYILYSDKQSSIELESPLGPEDGLSWYLHTEGDAAKAFSLNKNQVLVSAAAGDPLKKEEVAYDLNPSLQKDGFTVATRHIRLVIIPQIRFFYGTYYSDLNLTILLNQLHIALSNGYRSAAPTLFPEKYKSSFSIGSIQKDGKAFDNKDGFFEISSQTGVVTVKQNTVLTAGSYKLIVRALTTTGLTFDTDLTLNMSSAE